MCTRSRALAAPAHPCASRHRHVRVHGGEQAVLSHLVSPWARYQRRQAARRGKHPQYSEPCTFDTSQPAPGGCLNRLLAQESIGVRPEIFGPIPMLVFLVC
jgi:hypothetical protein